MHCKILNVAILAMLAAGASAGTHRVEVGQSGLKFTPDIIEADEGDIVEFHFNAMHSVVAGDFKNPCTPVASGGFYSGTMPMGDKSFFSITINNTEPIFFYCSVDAHCQGGMVGVINQGSDTLGAFRSAAENSENSISPKAPFGGTLESGPISATSATTSSPMSTSVMTGSQPMTATMATSKALSTVSVTALVTPSAPGTPKPSPTPSPTTIIHPGAGGHFIGPITGVTCLALVIGVMLAV